uniref:Lipoxygenase 2.1, chloroplastic n=1 Tax=Aegilops tauschii TaxID=37682 RepID=R7WCW5_AEGTA
MGPNGMHAFMEAPDKVLLDTFSSQHQSALVMAILDLLSSHSSGGVLGHVPRAAWRHNGKINHAFEEITERVLRIEVQLRRSDGDPMGAKTVMGMGVPTSISI